MKAVEYQTMRSVEATHWWYRGLRSMLSCSLDGKDYGDTAQILDAGCGTGAHLQWLRKRFPDALLTGVDRSEEALASIELSADAKTRLVCLDINRSLFPENHFDLIVATDLLGQRDVAWEKTLGLFFRSLKPGGILLLNVPAFSWLRGEHDQAVHVDKRFGFGELEEALFRAGYEKVDLRFWNCLLLPLMLAVRLFSRCRGQRKLDARSDLLKTPGILNDLMGRWILCETVRASRWHLPFGSSLFASARKPAGSGIAVTEKIL